MKKGRGRPKGSKSSKKKKVIKKGQAEGRNEKNVFAYMMKRFKNMLRENGNFWNAIERGVFGGQITWNNDG